MKTWNLFVITALAVCVPAGAQTQFSPVPTTVVGQPVLQTGTLTATAPNLVEGRELNSPQAVALDTSTSPPILYVADTGNNRVLGFKNSTGAAAGVKADLVIGQRDLFTTAAQGPFSGASLTSGLNSPTALVVDPSGNLYVADTGNNRILRFPKPAQQTGAFITPDLIIGQTDINGRSANQGLSAPTASTLSLSQNGSPLRNGLAINGNDLWVSDSGNNRVLRFSGVISLGANATPPAASIVLGQTSFTSAAQQTNQTATSKNGLVQPSGLTFDSAGDLFVADDSGRVLVYGPPFVTGQLAARVLGVVVAASGSTAPPPVNATQFATAGPPQAVLAVGNNLYVSDTYNNRILEFGPVSSYPVESTTFSPQAIAVFGQTDFFSGQSNSGNPQPSAATLSLPVGLAASGSTLFVADSGNNRVVGLGLNASGALSAATLLFGQVGFQYNTANLIEGREFDFYGNLPISGGGNLVFAGSAVIDRNSNPPHLYVADTFNNRILGYADYRKVQAGTTADLVIGQPDFFTSESNYPGNKSSQPNDQGLSLPQGLALDSNGNLYVTDSLNGRVLRFPQPFAQGGNLPHANLVLGQASFTSQLRQASANTMQIPDGIAFTIEGNLVVSDLALNRVLYFVKPGGGDFVSGQNASFVVGQPDFGVPQENTLSQPRGVSVDVDGHIYVADTGNNRIVIYPNLLQYNGNDPAPTLSVTTGASSGDTLHNPYSVYVSPIDGVVWVADTGANRLLRLPKFEQLLAGNAPATVTLASNAPVNVTLDPFGNPLALEAGTYRVVFYSPSIDYTSSAGGVPLRFSGNAANYFQRFAPGELATIFSFPQQQFGSQTVNFNTLPNPVPAPTTLGDVQVLVNGIAAPLLYVSPGQINFQVPYEVPTGMVENFRVVQASTGQILASTYFRVDPVAPGLFTQNSTGSGQLSVLNQDNTVNSSSSPAKAGTIIQIFGTGIGAVPGAPADGAAAAGPVPTDHPTVVFNGSYLPDSAITYSGLAPGLIGVWQVNVMVPTNVPPGNVVIGMVFKGQTTNVDASGLVRLLTVYVAPAQQ